MTRETVPRPTPARAATWSSVGRSDEAVTRSVSGLRAADRLMRADEVGVPPATRLHPALLGPVVDVDDAEPLAVSVRPLEVVQQRPHEVATQRHPLGDGPATALDVAGQVGGAVLVVDVA